MPTTLIETHPVIADRERPKAQRFTPSIFFTPVRTKFKLPQSQAALDAEFAIPPDVLLAAKKQSVKEHGQGDR
jgi:hypothetical protein